MENDPLIGKQLGAYLIQSGLGEGGMALVYKAYHARLRREVAIKVILPQIADQAGFRERFEREAQLIASLEHRNIVAVYDFGDLDNFTYLVMQYVGGGTLRDRLRRQGQLEIQQAIHYTIQMARALHHAHQRGIVHRDVKPQNMLLSASDPNEILLSDFGIAKIFDDSHQETLLQSAPGRLHNDPSLTSADQMIGTADYMAPEQINRQPVDARTDVYALGIVFFQMLTGQVPFTSTTIQGLLFQHVYTPPKPVRELNPNVPEALEKIIFRALAKAPAERFPSAEAMAQALEAARTSTTTLFNTPHMHSGYTSIPGQPALDAVTSPSLNRPPSAYPSLYGQQGQPSAPGANTFNPPVTRSNTPITGINSYSIAPPTRPIVRKKFRISYILYAIVALLAVGLLFTSVVSPWLCGQGLLCLGSSSGSPGGSTGGTLTSFTENFQNNDRNWSLSQKGLTAQVQNNQYLLSVADGNTYFPHPDPLGTANGPLPQNFTLTVQITETQGSPSTVYGLVFRLQGSTSNVDSYTFEIDGQRNYYLVKYTANKSSNLLQGQSTTIQASNQPNTLQVTVRSNVFSFKINGQNVVIPNTSNNTYTDNSQPWTGGQLGILVSGTNTQFTVTSVALVIQ
jgi:serine/threonine protein kinase